MIAYKNEQFNVIGQDEIDDYIKVLNRYNCKESEFSLSEKDTTDYSGDFYILVGEAIVKKISGQEKKYFAGHASAWVCDFEKDLKSGAFN